MADLSFKSKSSLPKAEQLVHGPCRDSSQQVPAGLISSVPSSAERPFRVSENDQQKREDSIDRKQRAKNDLY